jgi:hypothetical protein
LLLHVRGGARARCSSLLFAFKKIKTMIIDFAAMISHHVAPAATAGELHQPQILIFTL